MSTEKLCPVLSFYVVKDWRAACERCKEILRYGGVGHTMAIHSRNEQVILEFGLHKPAYRIVVNTPTTHGSIGLTTDLDPALTLGCGGFGGNITSDNIGPRHLLNIRRLAYGVRPAVPEGTGDAAVRAVPASRPSAPGPGLSNDAVRRQVEAFLASRGFGEQPLPATGVPPTQTTPGPTPSVVGAVASRPAEATAGRK